MEIFFEDEEAKIKLFIISILVAVWYKFNEIVEINLDELKKLLETFSPNAKKEIMTTYQLIKQEGVKEGLEKGLEQGLEQGLERKTVDVILKGYKNGISIDKLAIITGLSEQEVQKIIQKHSN